MFANQYFRINIYPLTAKSTVKGNILYFHGFTMHDQNYDLPGYYASQGLVGEKLPSKSPSQNWRDYFAELSSQTKQDQGYLVTVSFDAYEQQAYWYDLVDMFSEVSQLATTPVATKVIGFSYGVLLAQMLLKHLVEKHSGVDFKGFVQAYAIHGSLIPASNRYSIPIPIAKATLKQWDAERCFYFWQNIGLIQGDGEALRQRLEQVSPEVFAKQRDYLRTLQDLGPVFEEGLANDKLLGLWREIKVAIDDMIFPPLNLEDLGKDYNIPTSAQMTKHVLPIAELGDLVWEYSNREAV